MNRQEKADQVADLKSKFEKANAAFITHYRGMTVDMLYKLRKGVREGEGEVKVVKNRLAKIATKGSDFEGIASEFTGPVALVLSYKDPVPVAKAVVDCLDKDSPFVVKTANLEGKILNDKEVEALSKLPDRDTLLAMMLSAMQGPVRNFAGVLAAVPRGFATVLNAVKEQKEGNDA